MDSYLGEILGGAVNCLLVAVIIVAIALSVPRKGRNGIMVTPRTEKSYHQPMTREQVETYLRHMSGNYTAAELRRMDCEERENYNRNISQAAWWSNSNTYIDANGNKRAVGDWREND